MASSLPLPLPREDLIEQIRTIPQAMDDAKARKRENWPVRANRASELGHPCLRYLTYLRTAWQDRSLPSVDLQYLFDERARQEDHAIEDLREAGYVFIQQQRPFSWPLYEITGKIDGMLLLPRGARTGTSVPTEIKNVNPYDWRKVDPNAGLRQFIESDRVWFRRIPAQITAYLLMNNSDLGALVLRNAHDGRPKVIPVTLDYGIGEEILSKAEAVITHLKKGTLPDRIPYSEEICGRCPFFAICLPDEALRQAADLFDNPELEEKLRRRSELEAAKREYEALDKDVKEFAKHAIGPSGQAVVGTEWILQVSTSTRKAYSVSEATVQTVKVQRLGPATRDEHDVA